RSRFSRSKAFIFSETSLGSPARLPLSTSDFFTHSFSVCAEQPILAAIEDTAAHRDGCSPSCSATIRTARARTSGENLFVVLLVIDPTSHELGSPANPARFKDRVHRCLHIIVDATRARPSEESKRDRKSDVE